MTIDELTTRLERCHNLILTGAPGTGKTTLARKIANALTGTDEHTDFVQFHPSYDYTDFVEGLRPINTEDPHHTTNISFARQDGIFKAFCKNAVYHSLNIAFQKLLQEIKRDYNERNPLRLRTASDGTEFGIYCNNNGELGLITGQNGRRSGSISCENLRAWLNGTHPGYWPGYHGGIIRYLQDKQYLGKYVFIIDEINRGDISKIFGELFFALDPGYRGVKGRVKTQYTNLLEDYDIFKEGFYIPENVYIIGTMNDIDRNVESMDFAIRRRFSWVEIAPEDTRDDMWNNAETGIAAYKAKAKKCMDAINAVISDISGLGPAYRLGAAYFLKLRVYEGDFAQLWDYNIAPLLCEYLRGFPKNDVDAAKAKLKTAWNNAIANVAEAESETDVVVPEATVSTSDSAQE